MKIKIVNYVLDWNYKIKKGTIILVFENEESEAIRDLNQLDFLCFKSVLQKGNTFIEKASNSIFTI